eukprot:1072928-Amorphochlora_amoeboformis.AAC.1
MKKVAEETHQGPDAEPRDAQEGSACQTTLEYRLSANVSDTRLGARISSPLKSYSPRKPPDPPEIGRNNT